MMKLRYGILLIIFSLSITNAFSQMNSSATNHGGRGHGDGTKDTIFVGSNCEGTLEFSVLLSNLENYAPNPSTIIPNQVYTLPANYPSMYVELNLGDESTIVPVTQFWFKEEAFYSTDIGTGLRNEGGVSISGTNGPGIYTNVFKASFLLTADFSERCDGDTVLLVPASMRLLTTSMDSLTGYTAYPMCNYMYSDDIFSCMAFPDYCDFPVDCNHDDYNGSSTNIPVSCNPTACDVGLSEGRMKMESTEVTISPNPFHSILDINWADDSDQLLELSLFDISGKQVLSKTAFSKGSQSLSLKTAHLEKGLYFLKLRSQNTAEVFKLLKQ